MILFSDRLHSLQQMLSRTFKLHNPDTLGQLHTVDNYYIWIVMVLQGLLGSHLGKLGRWILQIFWLAHNAQSAWFTLGQALKSATSDLPYFVLERCGRFCGWIVRTFFWSFTLDYTLSQILFSYFVNPLSLFHHQILFHTFFYWSPWPSDSGKEE